MFKWKIFYLHLPSARIIEVCYQPAYRVLGWNQGFVYVGGGGVQINKNYQLNYILALSEPLLTKSLS